VTWNDVEKMRRVVGLDFPPEKVAEILDALLAARPILTHMQRFSDLAAEFDGDPEFVGEEMQRTWEAWDAYAADPRRVTT
jgi:hypothetical protein